MKQDRECIICYRAVKALRKNMCPMHYYRMVRNGDPYIIKKVARKGRLEHPLYYTYISMISRCYRAYNTNYKNYGARGISVFEDWLDKETGFELFVEYVGSRPEGKTLDRIDVDGNYEPGNLRWATASEQRSNTRWHKQNAAK